MQHEIKTYPVRHPLLRRNIRFFWEIRSENMNLDHKLIPQKNINMRFNLGGTQQYLNIDGSDHLLENVYFSGLQDHFTNAYIRQSGKVHMLGICFFPEGFYPFFRIPVSEFKNLTVSTDQAGMAFARIVSERLAEAPDIISRLNILENELLRLLLNRHDTPEKFRLLFNSLKKIQVPCNLNEFCRKNNLGIRNLERSYNRYIGVSASTYSTLNRFHNTLNTILRQDYSKLSDLAYDNGYFDQMHFIREFKRFSGSTPKKFINQNNSILQIGKME